MNTISFKQEYIQTFASDEIVHSHDLNQTAFASFEEETLVAPDTKKNAGPSVTQIASVALPILGGFAIGATGVATGFVPHGIALASLGIGTGVYNYCSSPSSEHDEIVKAYQIGKFKNSNNLCWMHSCTQVLLAAKEWLAPLLDKKIEEKPDCVISKALQQTIAAEKTVNLQEIDGASEALHKALCNGSREYANADFNEYPKSQQDAAAYFSSVLGELGYSYKMHRMRKGIGEDSLIKKIESSNEELIHLPIQEGLSLQETIDAQFSPQLISDEPWVCDEKVVPVRTEREYILLDEMQRPPEILFVHLKRFSYEQSDSLFKYFINPAKKIETPLEFPPNENREYVVDFSRAFFPSMEDGEEFLSEIPSPPKVEYELIGVVHHHSFFTYGSSINGGHYTADVLRNHPETGERQWFHCDDSGRQIKPISYEKVSPDSGYILAFRLKNQ